MSPVIFDSTTKKGEEFRVLAFDNIMSQYTFVSLDELYATYCPDKLWDYPVQVPRFLAQAAYVFRKGTKYQIFGSGKLKNARKWATSCSLEDRMIPSYGLNAHESYQNNRDQFKLNNERWRYQSYLDVMTNGLVRSIKSQNYEYYI